MELTHDILIKNDFTQSVDDECQIYYSKGNLLIKYDLGKYRFCSTLSMRKFLTTEKDLILMDKVFNHGRC